MEEYFDAVKPGLKKVLKEAERTVGEIDDLWEGEENKELASPKPSKYGEP